MDDKKYCQNCGSALDYKALFCPVCGETNNFGPTPPVRISQPLGVTILGALNLIGSLSFILIILAMPVTVSASQNGLTHVISFMPYYFILLIGIIMFLPFIFSIFFLMGYDFARVLMIIGAFFEIFTIIGIPWAILLLWYLTRPRVRAYFTQSRRRKKLTS